MIQRMSFEENAPELWAPLAAVVGSESLRDFMYMGTANEPGFPAIRLFKNIMTRRYINVDATGQAYSSRHNAVTDSTEFTTIPADLATVYALS